MDIDKIYNNMLSEYELTKKGTVQAIIKDKINYIVEQWNEKIKDKKVILWGAGQHTKEILKYTGIDKSNIVAIIDRNSELFGKKIEGVEIISKNDIKKYQVDLIVISSFAFMDEISSEITKLGYKYVNLYSNIDEDKEYIIKTRIEEEIENNYFVNYINIFYLKEKYCTEKEIVKKEFWLKELIISCLDIKDFVQAELFINKYIEKNYKNSKRYKEFLSDLHSLFKDIKVKINNNKNKKIVFTVCDALKYDDIEKAYKFENDLEYIGQMARESMYYTNAFANSTYTRACFKGMFEKKMILLDNDCENKKYELDVERSDILKLLIDNNYFIVNNGLLKIVNKENNIINLIKDKADYKCCTQQLWEMLTYICKFENSNIFILNHFLESHPPYFGGENRDAKVIMPWNIINDEYLRGFNKNKYNDAIKYLDYQIKFYFEFLDNKTYNIITNDHGQAAFYGCESETNYYSWSDCIIRSPLIISNKLIKAKVVDDLISKIDIDKIINAIVYDNKIPSMERKFVNIQRDSLYSNKLLNSDLLKGERKKFSRAFNVIRTKNEKYVLYDNGEEEFYIMPNECKNEINNKDHRKRIEEIRNLIEDNFSFK